MTALSTALRELHARRLWDSRLDGVTYAQTNFPDRCTSCRVSYPCPTIRLLDQHEAEVSESEANRREYIRRLKDADPDPVMSGRIEEYERQHEAEQPAPSEPDACTCGEFAGSSVRYADCPTHGEPDTCSGFRVDLPVEPDAAEEVALAELVLGVPLHDGGFSDIARGAARRILSSDWLAAHVARREADLRAEVERHRAVADSMQHFADVAERVERRNNELVAERDQARAEAIKLGAQRDRWRGICDDLRADERARWASYEAGHGPDCYYDMYEASRVTCDQLRAEVESLRALLPAEPETGGES